jgi:hypothetical protein
MAALITSTSSAVEVIGPSLRLSAMNDAILAAHLSSPYLEITLVSSF